MKYFGITGTIGSGKSLVSKIFSILDIPIFNADNEAKKIMISDESVILNLKNAFGENVYKNGEINKDFLSKKIFSSEENRNLVNSIVHPVVVDYFLEWAKQQKNKLVGIESALIFEAGLKNFLDFIILVECPENQQLKYICERDNINITKAQNIIDIQKVQFRNQKFDYVITNNNEKSLIEQIENCLSFYY